MENIAIILWKGEEVGTVSNIMNDMWYMDADWKHTHSDVSSRFMDIASKLKGEDVIKEPSKGLVAQIRYNESSTSIHYVLILSADKSKIFMRSISDEVAAYADRQVIEPWQTIVNPEFYETELKKEVTCFHPLKWKNVRAIAHRTDREDVLFEVQNGKSKYVVVHLTWRKESSKKWPATHFYKDWQDVFVNCIVEDYKAWKGKP